jgi:hypothetical protein
MYWETSVSIRWPSHCTILVSGRSVTSVRNGLPSTWPRNRTDACFDTGKSGFVTSVGCEKVGTRRSTRWLAGATAMCGTTGCGISRDE